MKIDAEIYFVFLVLCKRLFLDLKVSPRKKWS